MGPKIVPCGTPDFTDIDPFRIFSIEDYTVCGISVYLSTVEWTHCLLLAFSFYILYFMYLQHLF